MDIGSFFFFMLLFLIVLSFCAPTLAEAISTIIIAKAKKPMILSSYYDIKINDLWVHRNLLVFDNQKVIIQITQITIHEDGIPWIEFKYHNLDSMKNEYMSMPYINFLSSYKHYYP